VQFAIGSLPTSTAAIWLTWSEEHKLGKPGKKDEGTHGLVSGCPITAGNQLDSASSSGPLN
jgi:hypothetical protein